jgi:hypothetical protein
VVTIIYINTADRRRSYGSFGRDKLKVPPAGTKADAAVFKECLV